jgi:hypothetical protein
MLWVFFSKELDVSDYFGPVWEHCHILRSLSRDLSRLVHPGGIVPLMSPCSRLWSSPSLCILHLENDGHFSRGGPSSGMHAPIDTIVSNNNNNNTFTWCGPSGVLGYTGQRPGGPAAAWCMPSTLSYDGCHAVPFNLLNRVWKENPRGGKRLRPRFWRGLPLATRQSPFSLNRPHLASLQLRSHSFVIG